MGPQDVAARGADAVILALPNGEAAPYVAAIEAVAPRTIIVDLSADYRFDPGWTYGLPELYGRDALRAATRIANPGCYATAGQLCVHPVRDLLSGPAHLFGVSGYSGAGTTPSRKNDVEALKDNLMPYSLTGHLHEREMSRHLDHEVRFSPHVAAFFRGITMTAQLSFREPVTAPALQARYHDAYEGEPLIRLIDTIPEIRDGQDMPGAVIGGWSIGEGGRHATLVCALDNLLKGAAVQAVQKPRAGGRAGGAGRYRRSGVKVTISRAGLSPARVCIIYWDDANHRMTPHALSHLSRRAVPDCLLRQPCRLRARGWRPRCDAGGTVARDIRLRLLLVHRSRFRGS